AKDRPSRPRPLTLRSLTAPARAYKKVALIMLS
ncbi:MAG: Asp23/Gls24 family envelope stress response protein, partial [Lacticaseibacillus paracasei]|nr:Asp23/Gls24 family envelope stress response protein [Lacticaseibacillus paracasei]